VGFREGEKAHSEEWINMGKRAQCRASQHRRRKGHHQGPKFGSGGEL